MQYGSSGYLVSIWVLVVKFLKVLKMAVVKVTIGSLDLSVCRAEYPKSKLTVELDTAHATWVSHDVALISTKTGNLLFLSLVYDGR